MVSIIRLGVSGSGAQLILCVASKTQPRALISGGSLGSADPQSKIKTLSLPYSSQAPSQPAPYRLGKEGMRKRLSPPRHRLAQVCGGGPAHHLINVKLFLG